MLRYLCRNEENVLTDVAHAGANDAKRHSREDVGVVALSRVEGLALVGDGREGRAAGEHGLALGIFVGLLGGALGLAGGVAQGEDDGLLVESAHVLQDFGGEGASDGRGADQHRGLGRFHHIGQLANGRVCACKARLVARDAAVRAVLDDQTLRVDHPDALACLVQGGALLHHRHHAQVGDADRGLTSSLKFPCNFFKVFKAEEIINYKSFAARFNLNAT